MAAALSLYSRRNVKVEFFLKRCTERRVHNGIRAHELCVVISENVNKAYMHAVLCDELVLVTEYAPRTIKAAVSFRRVHDIQLVNDFPDFLSRSDRKCCQHIRITYVTDKATVKGNEWLRNRVRRFQHAAVASDSDPPKKGAFEGYPVAGRPPASLLTPRDQQSKKLKSAQRSTLLLDPKYRRKCRIYADASLKKGRLVLRTCQLFDQLSSELLQDQLSVEGLYLLLQELNAAAHRHLTLPHLFWRSGELCVFLVQTLEENLNGCQGLHGVYTPDHILLCTAIVETLTVMFAETRSEVAKLNLLSANNGSLASRMLLALICDPRPQGQSSVIGSQFQVLMSEYQDATCPLLFELLLLGREKNRGFDADELISTGWIFGVLGSHSQLPFFITHQAQQLVLALSDRQGGPLSPTQAVLLFQRCHLLLQCLQHSSLLAQHLKSHLREEFRYLVRPSQAKEKLLPHYPITEPILCLLDKVLALILTR